MCGAEKVNFAGLTLTPPVKADGKIGASMKGGGGVSFLLSRARFCIGVVQLSIAIMGNDEACEDESVAVAPSKLVPIGCAGPFLGGFFDFFAWFDGDWSCFKGWEAKFAGVPWFNHELVFRTFCCFKRCCCCDIRKGRNENEMFSLCIHLSFLILLLSLFPKDINKKTLKKTLCAIIVVSVTRNVGLFGRKAPPQK